MSSSAPTRTRVVGFLLLVASACGPGPGDATDTAATTGGSTTGGATADTTSSPATTGVASTGDTGGTAATTDTTGDPTTGTSGTTAPGPSCEAIVGSEDCNWLAEVSPDLELDLCLTCQGAPCGQHAECDSLFPCVEGAIVLRGCCTDEQCAGLTPFCGMFLGIDNICVESDDR